MCIMNDGDSRLIDDFPESLTRIVCFLTNQKHLRKNKCPASAQRRLV